MHSELVYQIALTMVPNVGAVQAKILVEQLGNASDIFKAKKRDLESIDGIGAVRAASIKAFDLFKDAEAELEFLDKYKIDTIFINDIQYPKRLPYNIPSVY
jgi:DNA processing protein